MATKKNLIIVESPSKAKTIEKFLGSKYQVVASKGHIRDLPKSTLGIDTDNDFEPKYITIRGKGQLVSDLKKAAKKADKKSNKKASKSDDKKETVKKSAPQEEDSRKEEPVPAEEKTPEAAAVPAAEEQKHSGGIHGRGHQGAADRPLRQHEAAVGGSPLRV